MASDPARRRPSRLVLLAAALLLFALSLPVAAQSPDVDALLARVFASKYAQPYRLTADFSATLVLFLRGRPLTAAAAGSYVEWEDADRQKHREVRVTRLDLPLLLRPFAGHLRQLIEEKIEQQPDKPKAFHAHDVFALEEQPDHRFILVGVYRPIVDEALDRAGRSAARDDAEARREMAHRLYTTPEYRQRLPRPGPPYALRAIVDESGYMYELTLFYQWGAVETRFSYTSVNDHQVWQTLSADTAATLTGVGRVDGKLAFTFTNHCFGCPCAGCP